MACLCGWRCKEAVRWSCCATASVQTTNEPGLYFCGHVVSSTGQLREIGLEAKRIGNLARHYVDPQTRLLAQTSGASVVQAKSIGSVRYL